MGLTMGVRIASQGLMTLGVEMVMLSSLYMPLGATIHWEHQKKDVIELVVSSQAGT